MRQTRLLLAKTRLLCGLCLALNLTHRIHLKIGEEENKGKLMHKLSCVGAQVNLPTRFVVYPARFGRVKTWDAGG
jgi:hypothetical protein